MPDLTAKVGTIEYSLGVWILEPVEGEAVPLNDRQIATLDRGYDIVEYGSQSSLIGSVATIDGKGCIRVWYEVPNATEAELKQWCDDALCELNGLPTSFDRADAIALAKEQNDLALGVGSRKGFEGYDRELEMMRLSR
jgi:hypothetical protein